MDNMDANGFVKGKFILMNDIDLSAYDNWALTNQDIYINGFIFNGIFDGNGYSIKNLTMDSMNYQCTYLGFFSILYNAEVKNLGLENADIKNAGEFTAGLAAASANSTISNCYVTGNVQGGEDPTFTRVGGLVASNGGVIDNCYSTADVSSGNSFVGGLVGVNGWQGYIQNLPDGTPVIIKNSQITNSFATGNVSGNYYVGGLVGAASDKISNISNVYATGNVSGNTGVGGLIGYNRSDSTIKYGYATGHVTAASQYPGGLIGANDGGFVSNCIWDTEKTGQSDGFGYNTDTNSTNKGLTSSAMQTLSNWAGWDRTIWNFSTLPPTFKLSKPVDPPKPPDPTDPDNPDNPDNPDDPSKPSVTQEGSIRLQVGYDEKNTSVIYLDTVFELGAFDVDFSTAEGCTQAIDDIDALLAQINEKRSDFGAVLNRLNSILDSQTTTTENFTATMSTIMDADIAEESANYVKNQILHQTATALLTQSQNTQASLVLSLLQ